MNTEPHSHRCDDCEKNVACAAAQDGGCIFPSTDHITCNPCAERQTAVTPIEKLEPHRFFRFPERKLLECAPHWGRVKFTRHQSKVRDARRRLTTASVEIITDRRYEPLPQPICVHSPTGLEWGYGGSGPADCAANILALFVSLPEAWRLHQRFKTYVAAVDQWQGGFIEVRIIRAWLEEQWQKELADPEQMEQEEGLRKLLTQTAEEATP